MGDCVKSLAEVEVDNIHCSPLIYLASHAIVEDSPLGESMLTAPDSLLFRHFLNDDL